MSEDRSRVVRKVIVASFLGNFVEWFDYATYSYLAVIISRVFFPKEQVGTLLFRHSPYSPCPSYSARLERCSGGAGGQIRSQMVPFSLHPHDGRRILPYRLFAFFRRGRGVRAHRPARVSDGSRFLRIRGVCRGGHVLGRICTRLPPRMLRVHRPSFDGGGSAHGIPERCDDRRLFAARGGGNVGMAVAFSGGRTTGSVGSPRVARARGFPGVSGAQRERNGSRRGAWAIEDTFA